MAADNCGMPGTRRPPAWVWMAAVTEIVVAVAVGAILVHYHSTPPTDHRAMHIMAEPYTAPEAHWMTTTVVVAACTMVAALVFWACKRARVAAMLAAVGLSSAAMSEPVRAMSLQSHTVAMAALEVLLVAAPLVTMSARRERGNVVVGRSIPWMGAVGLAVVLYGMFAVALHVPAIHDMSRTATAVPLWLSGAALIIGLLFWAAILLTERRATETFRRNALILGQEVTMILGLAALFVPSPYMQHANPLRLTASADQRIGGLLMVATCAAVTLPLVRRLPKQLPTQPLRTELHVH